MNVLKATVLLIDSNSDMRDVLGNMLHKKYNVVTKKDELEAFAWLQKGNIPASIILGLHSELDPSQSFIINLQTSGFWSEIPIVVLSADQTETFKADLVSQGAFSVLSKPFDPQVLMAILAASIPVRQEVLTTRPMVKKLTPKAIYSFLPNFREAVTGAMLLFINQYF